MTKRIPWFERTWNLDFPAGQFREIIERLRGTPLRVAALVDPWPRDVLIARDGDMWSIQQNVGHLFDLEPLWSGRLDDFLSKTPVMRGADLANKKTNAADHNDKPIQEVLDAFAESRASLVARLEALGPEVFAWTSDHPRLRAPMRLVDLCFFTAEHDDYHLVRITQLGRLFTPNAAATGAQ